MKQEAVTELERIIGSQSFAFSPEHFDTPPINLFGISVEVSRELAKQIVLSNKADFKAKGYRLFVSEQNFGINGKKDKVSILETNDPFDILRIQGSNGVNYDVDTDRLIEQLMEWNKKFGLEIVGAGGDWIEAEFINQPENMQVFAEEVYEFCPDVVEQGTDTVEALAEEMQETNLLFLWWD
jgi:hypothetical protein